MIKPIIGEDFILYYPWMRELDYTDITPEVCLSRCLIGQYKGYAGIKDGKPVGIAIYWTKNDFCFVVGLWCKNNLIEFKDEFWGLLKKQGINTVRGATTRNAKAYSVVTGMKPLWTVFEKRL